MAVDQDHLEARLKWWGITILILGFLALWASGFATGIFASSCRDASAPPDERLTSCTISARVGAWMHISDLERARGADVDLERGIALLQLGRVEEAKAAFVAARRNARAHPGGYLQKLDARLKALGDAEAVRLWAAAR